MNPSLAGKNKRNNFYYRKYDEVDAASNYLLRTCRSRLLFAFRSLNRKQNKKSSLRLRGEHFLL